MFEDDGATLTKDARTICEVVAENDVALATGHLSLPEIRALLDAATQAGVTRFIVTHANWSLCKLDLDVQRELIAKGATMEYVACSCVSPIFWEQQPGELAEWIIALRGENIVLGSDLGQFAGPPHPEGLRMLLAALIDIGVPYEYLEKMAKQTPALLLGLDPGWSTARPGARGSVMFTRPFRFERAGHCAEACELLRRHGEGAKVIAGGQSLMPLVNLGLVQPEVVIDISRADDGRDLGAADGFLRIGALVTHARLAADPLAAGAQPLLGAAARRIGNARVRGRGTLGGSLAHSDPAAELPLVMVALGATYEITDGRESARGARPRSSISAS